MEAARQSTPQSPIVLTHSEMSSEAYHADKSHYSSSQLAHILDTPAHFQFHQAQESTVESDLMRMGTAVHCALLEPATFPLRYVYAPRAYDLRRNADKAEVTAILAEHPGRTLISPSEAETLRKVVNGINAHATARALLSGQGDPELSIFWEDDLTGLPLKVRLDRYTRTGATGTMVEIKTTDCASAFRFGYKVVDMRYDMRAAMYVDGVQKAYGFTPDIVWIVIERDTGFVATYRPSSQMAARGRRLYEQSRIALQHALTFDTWPAYQSGETIETLDLPRKGRS